MENKEYSKEECGMCEGEECGQCSGMEYGGCGGHGMECQQMYGMRCGGRHHLLRWALGIVILVLVFAAGIKLGEFKERMDQGFGDRMMNRGYGYDMMQRANNNAQDVYYYRGGMMQGGLDIQKQMPVR